MTPRHVLRLTFALALAACAAPPPQITRAESGPTVVFEAGLGDTAAVWDKVALPLGLGRFAWTRAGYGLGPSLVAPRTWPGDRDGRRSGAEVSAQLAQELARQGVAPPYILVGHSLGGLYALQFAKDHPGQVAGIVLVDPRLPGFTAACKARGLRGCEVPLLMRLALLDDTERRELAGVPETEAALADLSALRDIPITLLVADQGDSADWRALWRAHAERFAAGFARARVVPVASGHYIQSTEPTRVTAEIVRLARAAAP